MQGLRLPRRERFAGEYSGGGEGWWKELHEVCAEERGLETVKKVQKAKEGFIRF